MNNDQLEAFEEEIGMRRDPAKEAQEALRAYQEQQGMVFENPDAPVGPDDKAIAMMDEKELDSTWMGGPRRG